MVPVSAPDSVHFNTSRVFWGYFFWAVFWDIHSCSATVPCTDLPTPDSTITANFYRDVQGLCLTGQGITVGITGNDCLHNRGLKGDSGTQSKTVSTTGN